jgi:hypothetical protein
MRRTGSNLAARGLSCVSAALVVASAAACSHTSSSTASQSSAVGGIPFPGAGNGGQNNLLLAGFTPNACRVSGPTTSFNGAPVQIGGADLVTCYYASASSSTPMAFLEQIVETAENQSLVHVRLTMNPAFVDNTYGDTAIGWGGSDAAAAMPGAPAAMGMAQPPAPGAAAGPAGVGGGTTGSMPAMPPGPGGHAFDPDLVMSDHALFDLNDRSGNLVLSFNLDYISGDSSAPSGYATLGVSGGDGNMITGNASAIAYASTSLDRDLNACGYGSYTTNSPATSDDYAPNRATPNWDYRVVYDVWVKQSAFSGGFGTATIPYVHASPSKTDATIPVSPGPCPPLCVGEGCQTGGQCVGEGCDVYAADGGYGVCAGEGCSGGGDCIGDWCDAGAPPSGCVGEGCQTGGGSCIGEFCEDASYSCGLPQTSCTYGAECCSGECQEGVCVELPAAK